MERWGAMIYFIILALLFLPLILYVILSIRFDVQFKVLYTYYFIEAILLIILTSIGHYYYYQAYDLKLFPSEAYSTFFFWASVLIVLYLIVIQAVNRSRGKDEGVSFKVYSLIFLMAILLFFWLTPLSQKYDYVKRLDVLEETFKKSDGKRVKHYDDIAIGLVASEKDRMMKPRYRSASYHNYIYIQNTGDTRFTGHVYLTIIDNGRKRPEIKLSENVQVEPGSIQLLAFVDNNDSNEWSELSFSSRHKVETFDADVVNVE